MITWCVAAGHGRRGRKRNTVFGLQWPSHPDPVRRTGTQVAAIAEAADGNGRLLCVWSASTHGQLVHASLPSVEEGRLVESMATFSADGSLVAARVPTSGDAWKVLLFDASSGAQRRSWDLKSRSAKIAFRTTIGVQLWAIDVEKRRMQRACAATESDLTVQQWEQFIGDYTGEGQRSTCAATLRPDAP